MGHFELIITASEIGDSELVDQLSHDFINWAFIRFWLAKTHAGIANDLFTQLAGAGRPGQPGKVKKEEYCYGCKYLTDKFWADGSFAFGCALSPGIVKGWRGAGEDEEPIRCDKYCERWRTL